VNLNKHVRKVGRYQIICAINQLKNCCCALLKPVLGKAHHLECGQQVERSSWLLSLVVTAEQDNLDRNMR